MRTPTTDLALDDIRLGDPALWLRPEREGIFAKLRAERPVSFHEEREFPGVPKGPGFWAVTRYADVVRASMDAESLFARPKGPGDRGGRAGRDELPVGGPPFWGW